MLGALGPQLRVEAPGEYRALGSRLEKLEAGWLDPVARLVGLDPADPRATAPISLQLAPESSDLARSTPPWVAGFADGNAGAIVLFPGRAPGYPDSSLDDVLRHELAHVLIARAAGGREVPRWFHEGVAVQADNAWGLSDRSYLTFAMIADREVPFPELERRFSGEAGEVRRAYAVAGAFVRDLRTRYGPGVVGDVLTAVADGRSFGEAFEWATGTSLLEAGHDFWRRQSFWYRWVPVLSSSVTLWLLITLLALVAIRRRRARDAARRRLWEEQEAVGDGHDDDSVPSF